MTSRDFVYWLQGYFELSPSDLPLSKAQQDCIKRHLAMVFAHEIDPSMGAPAHQVKLAEAHADPTCAFRIWEADGVSSRRCDMPSLPGKVVCAEHLIKSHPDGGLYRC